MAVDPDFNENKYIYLYYTREDGQNRISQFILDGTLTGENILWITSQEVPYITGPFKIRSDGKLYATTGDAGAENIAQDVNSWEGKFTPELMEQFPVTTPLVTMFIPWS